MSSNLIVGLLATFIPLFAVGYLMLKGKPPIFRMFVAMLLVGLGYLTATGAIEDIGARVAGGSEVAVPAEMQKAPEAAKAAAPAAEAPKADAAPAPAEEKPAEAPKP